MFLQKLLLSFLLVFVVVHFARCFPLKTDPAKNRKINSQGAVKYDQKQFIKNRKQSIVNRKQYPKSNDVHYGKVVKQKITPTQDMSNVIYDGHHVVKLIAKAKASKDKHTIKEHALLLEKSAADKSGNLVDIDVFRRLLHLQAMRRDGINFNKLGQPLIDHTIDILNRMKLGSQYPKLAFEILDGQSLLDIMSAYQPTEQQQSTMKNSGVVATRKSNNTKNLNNDKIKHPLNDSNVPRDNLLISNDITPLVKANNRHKSKSAMSDPLSNLHSVDGGPNTKFNSPNGNTFQYPFDQSENMIVDYPIEKPMKTGGRNLLDADYTVPVLEPIDVGNNTDTGIQKQGVSDFGKQGVIDNQGSVNIGPQVNVPTTTSNPVTDGEILGQQPLLDTPGQDRSLMVTSIHGQSQNDSGIQSLLPKETNHLGRVFEIGNPGITVPDTKQTIINSGGEVLTSTPADVSLGKVALAETFAGNDPTMDPTIVGDADFLLQNKIKNLLQNTTFLMGEPSLATQLEAPTGMVSPTAIPTYQTTNPTRLASTSLLESIRSNTTVLGTTSESQGTSVATYQATKYQSSPTTEENLTVDANFDWCTLLCKVMKRCSPACSGHFTSWNR